MDLNRCAGARLVARPTLVVGHPEVGDEGFGRHSGQPPLQDETMRAVLLTIAPDECGDSFQNEPGQS